MLPSFPESLTIGTTFQYVEGPQFEFKSCKSQKPDSNKIIETICAFLNSVGGYMIYGIEDNGNICGITRKCVDIIALIVDSIICNNRIINTTTGGYITKHEVSVITIPLTSSLYILTIKVVSSKQGHIYQLYNGIYVYRMSASNYKTKNNMFSDLNDMNKLRTDYNQLSEEVIKLRAKVDILEIGISTRAHMKTIMQSIQSKIDKKTRMIDDLRNTNTILASDLKKCQTELETKNTMLNEYIIKTSELQKTIDLLNSTLHSTIILNKNNDNN